jgi:hypothetical protein
MIRGANPAFVDGGRWEAIASGFVACSMACLLLRWASYGDKELAPYALLDTVVALGLALCCAAMVAK